MPENREVATEFESIPSEHFLKIYANSVLIEAGPWDFRLVFGETTRSGAKVITEQLVSIVMSPQHAKVFANILMGNVREYEKQVGEINIPVAPVEKLSPRSLA
jgi:hypothetical protein